MAIKYSEEGHAVGIARGASYYLRQCRPIEINRLPNHKSRGAEAATTKKETESRKMMKECVNGETLGEALIREVGI